jgi:predicted PolB exonuclease-like 3'-5' exonuclease
MRRALAVRQTPHGSHGVNHPGAVGLSDPARTLPSVTPRRFVALDLETVPDEDLVAAVDGEPARPYPEKLRRLLDERRSRSGGRTDFLPIPYHRPVVACTLEAEERDGVVRVVDASTWTDRAGDEVAFLRRIWQRIAGRTLVSFHGRGFDMPVLEMRSLKLGVPAPRWFQGARAEGAEDHLDLIELLSNGRAAPAAPLDLYAKLVGLPGKGEVAGPDVHSLYAAGALERIAAYCMTDVVQTWLLLLRFRLVEGSLTPDGYEESVASARRGLPRLFARRLGVAERALLDGFLARCAPFFGGAAEAPRRRASS